MADAAVSIGPNLRALAVYLVVFRHVPVERCARLIADVTGAQVSDGFVHSCLAKTAEAYGWEHIAGHQASLAHLVRDFGDAAECCPGAIWPVQAQRALRGLTHGWHSARDQDQPEIPPRIRDPLIREFRHAIVADLSDVPRLPGPKGSTAQHPGRDLLEFCRDRQGDVLRFCHDTRIWLTNNISERGVRPVRTQQKISGRLTGEEITQARWTSAATSIPRASTART